jgi:hypothetical protein
VEQERREELRRRKNKAEEGGRDEEDERNGGMVDEWVRDLMVEEEMLRVGDERELD